jgi:hypothetical protein
MDRFTMPNKKHGQHAEVNAFNEAIASSRVCWMEADVVQVHKICVQSL